MSKKRTSDVTIIGGGLAGLTLSCLLGQAGLDVICADRMPAGASYAADERTTAISYGSQKVLERIDVWKHLEAIACPIRDVHIMDGEDSPLLLQFLSDDVEGKSFGWVIENTKLRAALNERAKQIKSVTHLCGAAATSFEIAPENASTVFADGTTIQSAVIIGADGRGSGVRDYMQVDTRRTDYKQRAIITIINHENPHENKAIEHFYEQGPFAVLPMVDDADGKHRSAVVLTEHGRTSFMDMSDKDYAAHLQSLMPAFYGQISLRAERTCYPLSLVHAADYIAPRMALVADAAHGIHPVAGQGLNLGFRDVKELADLLIAAHKAGDDLGAPELLGTYQRRRRPDNMAMVAVTDAIVKLFSARTPSARFLRKFGLKTVAKIPAAKRFFMRQAMADRKLMEK